MDKLDIAAWFAFGFAVAMYATGQHVGAVVVALATLVVVVTPPAVASVRTLLAEHQATNNELAADAGERTPRH